jgi:nanoRNase/pAp phosphatase (c-di-AMP/oligoRNAs hydrolase)
MKIRELMTSADRALILGHQNADPDAVCAMLAMEDMYKQLNAQGEVVLASDDVSRLSSQVLSIFSPDSIIVDAIESSFDLVVLVDTNSRFQLGTRFHDLEFDPDRTIIIDHHEKSPEIHTLSTNARVESDYSSTAEIIVEIYNEIDLEFTPRIANLLLTGILFDTRRFYHSDSQTLKTAITLIEAGADYSACVNALTIRPDRSERIARLKAAGRLQIHNVGDWVIVTSKIGAFEASACRGILDMGADVAIVGGRPSKSIVRISARSTQRFSRETEVNLGKDIMEPLGELIDGEGGGHPNAAGANGKRNLEAALEQAVRLIRNGLERGRGEVESTGTH